MKIKNYVICLGCLFLSGMGFAESELTFDVAGRVCKLMLGGKEMLGSGSSSGFELEHNGGKRVRLTEITVSGNKIKVSAPDGKPSFTFKIDPYPHHIAIHLLEAQGIGDGRDVTLRLKLDAKEVAVYTLNDLMTARSKRRAELNWPFLWGRARPNGTRGSAVLYDDGLNGSARDAVLAEIWSVQGTAGHMVRPAGQKSWMEADVMSWVERWVKTFEKMVVVCVAPKNEKELYEMTEELVIPSGANRVYMFSTHWRGEYTLVKLSNESVAGDAFPNGKEDLLNYSNYLAGQGAHLQLKSLVPQLGHDDKRYFSASYCEPRLLSWGTGTLAEDIDPNATTIRFKPGPAYVWKRDSGFLRIGNELIMANKISTDGRDGEWVFSDCNRGKFATTSKSHPAGETVAGVVHSYGFVHFVDDFGQPDSLAEKVLNAYGDFLNEVNVGHLHFDGTGQKAECPWYLRDYTDYVYSRIDHPVTGSRVGGSIPANFEKMFSMAERATKATGYWGIRIGPRLHGMGRGSEKERRNFAPNLLDMHFDISDRLALGGRRPNFTAGRSGGTLSMDILKKYGLIDEAFELFKNWIELAPVFDEADVDYVKSMLKKRRGSNHYNGEDVLVLGKNGDGDYIFTPHRVMGRTSGEDALIFIDQEWGAIPRYQEITESTTLELLNPYKKQEPQVLICVKDDSAELKDPLIKVNGAGELSVTGAIQPGEYMRFEGGHTVTVYDCNWNQLRELPIRKKAFTMNEGKNTVTLDAGSGSNKPDIKVQFITLGPVYILESNKHL